MPSHAKEVLGYFLRNPHAADTLEGIVRWWLMAEHIRRSIDEIGEALAWLVQEGFLVRETGSDPLFRFRSDTADRAEAFVSDKPDRGTGE